MIRLLPVAVGVLAATQVFADQRVVLTLAEAEDLVSRNEPGELAFQAQAAALEERAVVAGELPDPMLRLALNNFPFESGGFSTEGMTHAAIGLRQEFPRGESRSIDERRYGFLANEMRANAAARSRNVLAATRKSWLDVYYWERAHALVIESRPLFEDLATTTRSLYAVGRKSQQDLVRAELELGRLDDRLIEIERQRARARAALLEWIGRSADRPVATSLPDWTRIPELESLRSALLQHPALRAADALVDARGAAVELAGERSKPGWALDIGYSYREGSLPTGTPRSDFISVGITVALPFFRKRSVDSALTAALQERRASQSERDRMLRELQSRLDAEWSQWHELSRRIELYDGQILGQTAIHAQATLLAYQNDQGDFADVMRAHIDELNTQIDYVRLQVARAQSYAVLANLGGISQ